MQGEYIARVQKKETGKNTKTELLKVQRKVSKMLKLKNRGNKIFFKYINKRKIITLFNQKNERDHMIDTIIIPEELLSFRYEMYR